MMRKVRDIVNTVREKIDIDGNARGQYCDEEIFHDIYIPL
jgi:hypothetical protein